MRAPRRRAAPPPRTAPPSTPAGQAGPSRAPWPRLGPWSRAPGRENRPPRGWRPCRGASRCARAPRCRWRVPHQACLRGGWGGCHEGARATAGGEEQRWNDGQERMGCGCCGSQWCLWREQYRQHSCASGSSTGSTAVHPGAVQAAQLYIREQYRQHSCTSGSSTGSTAVHPGAPTWHCGVDGCRQASSLPPFSEAFRALWVLFSRLPSPLSPSLTSSHTAPPPKKNKK
jgi:hypothetical protein